MIITIICFIFQIRITRACKLLRDYLQVNKEKKQGARELNLPCTSLHSLSSTLLEAIVREKARVLLCAPLLDWRLLKPLFFIYYGKNNACLFAVFFTGTCKFDKKFFCLFSQFTRSVKVAEKKKHILSYKFSFRVKFFRKKLCQLQIERNF